MARTHKFRGSSFWSSSKSGRRHHNKARLSEMAIAQPTLSSSTRRPRPRAPLGKSPLCLETLPQKRHRLLTSGDVLGPRTGATVLSSTGVMAPLVPGGPQPVPGRSLPAPTTPPQRPFRVGEGIEPRWRMTATPRGVWECWGYLQPLLPSLLPPPLLPAASLSSPRVLFPLSSIYVPGSAFFKTKSVLALWECRESVRCLFLSLCLLSFPSHSSLPSISQPASENLPPKYLKILVENIK